MNYKIHQLPQSTIELKVSISKEDLLKEVEFVLEESRKDLELPGFRKGNVPRDLARKTIGEFALCERALKKIASRALVSIFEKESIEPIAQPKITVTKLAPGDDAEFVVKFPILPKINLPENWKEIAKKATQEKKTPEVKEEEVDSALTWLQESRAKNIPVNRPAKKGDVVTATISASCEGKPIPNATLKHHSFLLGRAHFMPGLEDKIEGLSKGESKDFLIKSPNDYWAEELRGKTIQFHVEIEDIKEREIPLLNDEFARNVGRFNSLEELRSSIREGIFYEKLEKEKERIRILILERLAQEIKPEIPQILLEQEIDRMIEELKSSVEEIGVEWQQYLTSLKQTESTLREAFKNEAIRRASFALILYRIAKLLGIEPDEEEVEEEIEKYLSRYVLPEEAQNIDIEQLKHYTRNRLRNEKTFQYLETLSERK